MKRKVIVFLGLVCVLLITTSLYVFANDNDPTPPQELTSGVSERFNNSNYASRNASAIAGNITQLTFIGISPTEAWAGFYGEITGTITLDDANENTLYNWSASEPQGRIYASNASTVNWTGIKCFNYSGINEINLSTLEAAYGIADQDVDGINETFGDGNLPTGPGLALLDAGNPHPSFVVGIVPISAGSCPATTTFENDRQEGEHFIELILTDRANVVFTTIIENRTTDVFDDVQGFDGVTHDFQMLVLDDGHSGDTSTTTWFFFVELE